MNSLSLLLTVTTAKGFFCLLLLFVLCFFGVHLFRLAIIGIQSLQQPPPPPEAEEKKAPSEQPQEPVYYIVERKTRRKNPSYGEPKEIRFK